jgi:hypothetical protein
MTRRPAMFIPRRAGRALRPPGSRNAIDDITVQDLEDAVGFVAQIQATDNKAISRGRPPHDGEVTSVVPTR